MSELHLPANETLDNPSMQIEPFKSFPKPNLWDYFALIIPVVAILPLLHLQSIFLLEREHMQFFPLAFAAVAWFFYNEGDDRSFSQLPKLRRVLAVIISLIVIAFGSISLFLISPWVAHLTLVLAIFAWGLGRFANITTLRITGICGLIAVTIPPPFGLDKSMVTGLQSLSSTICSHLIDITEIIHLRRGNVIEIPSKPLFVEEACSGVDSQYALMAVAGVLLLLARTGMIVSIITIVTVPIWAILGNLLRIYSIVIGLEFLGVDLAVGTKHTILGLFSFAGAAYAHWSSVQFLNYLQYKYFTPQTGAIKNLSEGATSQSLEVPNIPAIPSSSAKANWFDRKVYLIAPGLLLVLMPMGMLGWYHHFLIKLPSISQPIADSMPGEKGLPRTVLSQTRVAFNTSTRHERNSLGQHSHTWSYQGPNGLQTLSFDFPFRGFHPLWECYTASGWTRTKVREISDNENLNSTAWSCYEVELQNPEGEFGWLHFCFFDEFGNVYNHDGPVDEFKPNRAAVNFIDMISKPIRDLDAPLLFQIQIFSKSDLPPTESQLAFQRQLFLNLRGSVMQKTIPILDKVRAR